MCEYAIGSLLLSHPGPPYCVPIRRVAVQSRGIGLLAARRRLPLHVVARRRIDCTGVSDAKKRTSHPLAKRAGRRGVLFVMCPNERTGG